MGLLFYDGDTIIAWIRGSSLVRAVEQEENRTRIHLHIGPPIVVDVSKEELEDLLEESDRREN